MTTVKRNAQWNLFCRAIVLSRNRNAVSMNAQCAPAAAIILLQWLRTADEPVISVSVRYCSAVGKHVFLSTVSIRGSLMYFTSCAFLQDKTTSTCFDIDRPLVIKWDLSPIRPALDGDICCSAVPTQSIGQTCHYISLLLTVSMIKDGWNKLLFFKKSSDKQPHRRKAWFKAFQEMPFYQRRHEHGDVSVWLM